MAVLTPQLFDAAVRDVWARAQDNFHHDHFVYGHLIGISREAQMCHLAQAGTPEEIARMEGGGITPVPPGPWQHHLGLVDATLRANGSVAAIWVGEAWTVSDTAAVDALVTGTPPSEHPFKDEFVFVHATWPRARIHHLSAMRINRGKKNGDTPVLEAFPSGHPLNDDAASATQRDQNRRPMVVMFGWLGDLLPQPPTKR